MSRFFRKRIYQLQYFPCFSSNILDLIIYLNSSIYKYNIKLPKKDNKIEHIVSDKFQFIYIAIPKVATRSFISYFTDPQFDQHSYIKEDKINNIKSHAHLKNYYCFTFVRHPVDRIISCYKDKILYPSKIHEARVICKYKNLYKGMPFEEFVDWLLTSEGSDEIADRHWLSQHVFIKNQCDFIGKIENFQEDALTLEKQLNIPLLSLPHKNVSQRSTEISLNDSIKEKLYHRYHTDFVYFDYSLD